MGFLDKLKSNKYRMGNTKMLLLSPVEITVLLATMFDEVGINNALPSIQKEMNLSKSTAEWMGSCYYLGIAAFSVPSGKLSERFGFINVLQIAALLFGIVDIISFFVKNFFVLLICRFTIGMLAAFMLGIRNSLTSKYPAQELAEKAIMIEQILSECVNSVTPLIVGYIIKLANWRYSLIIAGVFSICIAVVLIPFHNNDIIKQKTSFDIWGIIFLVIAASTFCLSFTLLSNELYLMTALSCFTSITTIVLFIFNEKRHKDPILPLHLMKNPVGDLILNNTVCFLINIGSNWFLPEILNDSIKTGYCQFVGNLFTVGVAFSLIYILKKVVNRYVLYFGQFAIMLTIPFTIAFIKKQPIYIVTFICIYTFMSFIMETLFPMILLSVSEKHKAKIATMPPASRCIGSSISLCLFSSLTQIFENKYISEGQSPSEAFLSGSRFSFGVMFVFTLAIFLDCIFRIGNYEKEEGRFGYKTSLIKKIKGDNDINVIVDNKGIVLESEKISLLNDDNYYQNSVLQDNKK